MDLFYANAGLFDIEMGDFYCNNAESARDFSRSIWHFFNAKLYKQIGLEVFGSPLQPRNGNILVLLKDVIEAHRENPQVTRPGIRAVLELSKQPCARGKLVSLGLCKLIFSLFDDDSSQKWILLCLSTLSNLSFSVSLLSHSNLFHRLMCKFMRNTSIVCCIITILKNSVILPLVYSHSHMQIAIQSVVQALLTHHQDRIVSWLCLSFITHTVRDLQLQKIQHRRGSHLGRKIDGVGGAISDEERHSPGSGSSSTTDCPSTSSCSISFSSLSSSSKTPSAFIPSPHLKTLIPLLLTQGFGLPIKKNRPRSIVSRKSFYSQHIPPNFVAREPGMIQSVMTLSNIWSIFPEDIIRDNIPLWCIALVSTMIGADDTDLSSAGIFSLFPSPPLGSVGVTTSSDIPAGASITDITGMSSFSSSSGTGKGTMPSSSIAVDLCHVSSSPSLLPFFHYLLSLPVIPGSLLPPIVECVGRMFNCAHMSVTDSDVLLSNGKKLSSVSGQRRYSESASMESTTPFTVSSMSLSGYPSGSNGSHGTSNLSCDVPTGILLSPLEILAYLSLLRRCICVSEVESLIPLGSLSRCLRVMWHLLKGNSLLSVGSIEAVEIVRRYSESASMESTTPFTVSSMSLSGYPSGSNGSHGTSNLSCDVPTGILLSPLEILAYLSLLRRCICVSEVESLIPLGSLSRCLRVMWHLLKGNSLLSVGSIEAVEIVVDILLRTVEVLRQGVIIPLLPIIVRNEMAEIMSAIKPFVPMVIEEVGISNISHSSSKYPSDDSKLHCSDDRGDSGQPSRPRSVSSSAVERSSVSSWIKPEKKCVKYIDLLNLFLHPSTSPSALSPLFSLTLPICLSLHHGIAQCNCISCVRCLIKVMMEWHQQEVVAHEQGEEQIIPDIASVDTHPSPSHPHSPPTLIPILSALLCSLTEPSISMFLHPSLFPLRKSFVDCICMCDHEGMEMACEIISKIVRYLLQVERNMLVQYEREKMIRKQHEDERKEAMVALASMNLSSTVQSTLLGAYSDTVSIETNEDPEKALPTDNDIHVHVQKHHERSSAEQSDTLSDSLSSIRSTLHPFLFGDECGIVSWLCGFIESGYLCGRAVELLCTFMDAESSVCDIVVTRETPYVLAKYLAKYSTYQSSCITTKPHKEGGEGEEEGIPQEEEEPSIPVYRSDPQNGAFFSSEAEMVVKFFLTLAQTERGCVASVSDEVAVRVCEIYTRILSLAPSLAMTSSLHPFQIGLMESKLSSPPHPSSGTPHSTGGVNPMESTPSVDSRSHHHSHHHTTQPSISSGVCENVLGHIGTSLGCVWARRRERERKNKMARQSSGLGRRQNSNILRVSRLQSISIQSTQSLPSLHLQPSASINNSSDPFSYTSSSSSSSSALSSSRGSYHCSLYDVRVNDVYVNVMKVVCDCCLIFSHVPSVIVRALNIFSSLPLDIFSSILLCYPALFSLFMAVCSAITKRNLKDKRPKLLMCELLLSLPKCVLAVLIADDTTRITAEKEIGLTRVIDSTSIPSSSSSSLPSKVTFSTSQNAGKGDTQPSEMSVKKGKDKAMSLRDIDGMHHSVDHEATHKGKEDELKLSDIKTLKKSDQPTTIKGKDEKKITRPLTRQQKKELKKELK
ncbi:hypothetical protein ADUPG1_009086, partial [Aduncisulcus paluster]